jgi:hypothetical protein
MAALGTGDRRVRYHRFNLCSLGVLPRKERRARRLKLERRKKHRRARRRQRRKDFPWRVEARVWRVQQEKDGRWARPSGLKFS